MRYLLLFGLLTFVVGCEGVTTKLNEVTGTTKVERCEARRTAIAGVELRQKQLQRQGKDLSQTELDVLELYRGYVAINCISV